MNTSNMSWYFVKGYNKSSVFLAFICKHILGMNEICKIYSSRPEATKLLSTAWTFVLFK